MEQVFKNVTIRVEQFQSLQIRPLLNFIFFDQDASTLPARYVRLTPEETKSFFVDKLHNYETLQLYYNVLNIIGRRMHEHPEATITVTGCNDATGNELGNENLSRQRAETVRDYLANVWNISLRRMKVSARNLPADSSNIAVADGIQENRRVEISSETWEIVQPVITRDTGRERVAAEYTLSNQRCRAAWRRVVVAASNGQPFNQQNVCR